MRIRISTDFSVHIEFIGNGVIRWLVLADFDGDASFMELDRKQSAHFLRLLRQEC